MKDKKKHWCCDCLYYRGKTSIGAVCGLTNDSIYDQIKDGEDACEKWEECIKGNISWEDIAKIITIYEQGVDNGDYRRYNDAEWMKEYSQDILRKFNKIR